MVARQVVLPILLGKRAQIYIFYCVRVVAETVQNFITVMDSLKLDMAAVDQLYPLLTELMASLNNNLNLPPDFEMKVKLKNWLNSASTLN